MYVSAGVVFSNRESSIYLSLYGRVAAWAGLGRRDLGWVVGPAAHRLAHTLV